MRARSKSEFYHAYKNISTNENEIREFYMSLIYRRMINEYLKKKYITRDLFTNRKNVAKNSI